MVTQDYVYMTNSPDEVTDPIAVWVRAQEGIATGARAGVPSLSAPTFPFHVQLSENKNAYGLKPRHVELGRIVQGVGGSSCLVQRGVIRKKLVILTEARFNEITEFDGEDPSDAPNSAKISLPSKPDGTGIIDYVVIKKVSERYV